MRADDKKAVLPRQLQWNPCVIKTKKKKKERKWRKEKKNRYAHSWSEFVGRKFKLDEFAWR